MREVEMTKDVYDRLVYPGIAGAANSGPRAESDLRIQDKVLTILERQGKPISPTRLQPTLCDRCGIEMMHEPEVRPPALYEMTHPIAAIFRFEAAEAAYVVEKMIDHLPRVQGRLARSLISVFDALKIEVEEKAAHPAVEE